MNYIKSSRIAALIAVVLVFWGVARAETFSAVMIAERKSGVDDATWTLFSGLFDDDIRNGESFPPPTSGSVTASAVRWEWVDADSGAITAAAMNVVMQGAVDNFNNETEYISPVSTWSLSFDGNPGGGGVARPTLLMATTAGADSITLTWNYPQVSEFRFEIHRGETGTFADDLKIAEVNGVTTFTDTEAELFTEYFYWVIAVKISNSEKSQPGLPVIGSAGGKPPIPMVTGLTAKRSDFFSIILDWDTLDPVKYGYVLFENGETIYPDPFPPIAGQGSDEGVLYSYTVAAVRKSDGEIGPQSPPVRASIVGLGTDGGLRISASDGFGGFHDRISIVWSTPDDLEGEFYELYRAETTDFGTALRIAQLPVIYGSTGNFVGAPSNYGDLAVTEGKTYHYWVQIRDFGGAVLLRSDRDEGYLGEPDADPDCVDPEAGPQQFNAAQEAFLKASNTGGGDQFGYAVAIDGDIAVVGAPGEDSSSRGINGQQADENAPQSGAVYILSRDPLTGIWEQEAYLKPPVASSGANAAFGQSVAISGSSVVVGAPGDNDGKGKAYVFLKQGGTWSEQATLVANDPDAWQGSQTPGDGLDVSRPGFGHAVAIDGETILVGAPFRNAKPVSALAAYPYPPGFLAPNYRHSATGAAFVFTRSSGTWSQRKVLLGANTNQAVGFYSTDPAADSPEFKIARYEEMKALWGCDESWWEVPNAAGDPRNVHFGFSVALSGGVAVIGAPGDRKPDTGVFPGDHLGCPSWGYNNSFGSASVFEGSGAAWTQTAYLKTPAWMPDTGFGRSVAVDGRTVVVGSPYDGSDATAVDGGHNNSAPISGAAYVFVSDSGGSPWRQQAFLKSTHAAHTTPDGGSVWFFGSALSLQGDRLLVAAPTMVRESCVKSGVAYLFGRQGETWSQQATVRPTANGDVYDLFGGRHGWDGATGLAMDGDTALVGAPGEDSNARGVGGDESTNGSAESGAAYVFSLAATFTSYSEWASSKGLPADPSMAGGDGNSNGVPDIFEYLLKLPAGNPASGLPRTIIRSSEGGLPEFTFTLAAGSRPDAEIKIRTSETMQAGSWEVIATKTGDGPWSGTSAVLESVQPDGSVVITVENPWTIDAVTEGFFRLEAMLQ